MKKQGLIIILSFFYVIGFGSEVRFQDVRGTVKDAMTGYPLPGAHIVLLHLEPLQATTTDANGHFLLKQVPVGRQSIEIRYIGYETQRIENFLINTGKQASFEIKLEESTIALEEVQVSSKTSRENPLNEMALASSRSFTVEETERYAGSLGDPARMVANFAGIMTQNDSRNDIIIRGNSPMGLQWRIEGIEVPNPNHFGAQGTTGGPVSMINNNLLRNSDFLTGAFPAEYGNAIAGVFDLNLRSGNTYKNEFVGQIGFNGFEAGAEGPLFKLNNEQKASYLANFRYSTLELMEKLGFGSNTGAAIPQYKDFTFVTDIPGTKAGRFKVFGLWGTSMIRLGRNLADTAGNQYNLRGTATDFGSDLAVLGITHTYYFNPKTSIKSSLSWQHFNSKTIFDSVQNTGFMPVFRGNQTERKTSFGSQLRHKKNARSNFLAGFTIDQFGIDFQDSVLSMEYNSFISQTAVEGKLWLYRAFGQWQQKIGENLTANVGLHTQYTNQNNEFIPEGRFAFKWQLNARNSFTLGFGMHSQLQPKAVYFYQTYLPSSGSYILTNDNVGMSRSNHYVIGHQILATNYIRIKTEVYHQQLYKIPVQENFPEFSMINAGDFFSIPLHDSLVNEGKGKNTGLELTIERFLNQGWYLLFTASVFDSKYTGYDGVWRNTAFNGNYVFNLLGGYEFQIGKHSSLTIDLKTVWAGGKRFIPVNFEASLAQGEEVRDYARSYDKRYDDYFRTDLRLGYKINHKKFSQEWAIDLQNIGNYQSIFMESYDLKKNEVYQIYQQGFMPMFLYRIHF